MFNRKHPIARDIKKLAQVLNTLYPSVDDLAAALAPIITSSDPRSDLRARRALTTVAARISTASQLILASIATHGLLLADDELSAGLAARGLLGGREA